MHYRPLLEVMQSIAGHCYLLSIQSQANQTWKAGFRKTIRGLPLSERYQWFMIWVRNLLPTFKLHPRDICLLFLILWLSVPVSRLTDCVPILFHSSLISYLGMSTKLILVTVSHLQCDQIRRFIAIWATFQSNNYFA